MSYSVQFTGTGSDDTALLLKRYTGNMANPWRSGTFLWDQSSGVIERHSEPDGKEFQYLLWADLPAPLDYDPGDEIMGQNFAIDEVNITPDKYLIEAHRVPRDKMRLSHFREQVAGNLGRLHGNRLARQYDYRAFTLAGLGARQAAVTKDGLPVHSGGTRVTRTGGSVSAAYPRSATGAANFRADLRELGREMDEKNIPRTNRWITYLPQILDVLLFDTTGTLFGKDFIDSFDGNKVIRREVQTIDGFKVLKDRRGALPNAATNNGPFPDSNISSGLSKYQADFSIGASTGQPVAMAFCTDDMEQAPLAVIEFEPMGHHVQYIPERMEWLFLSWLYVGGGVTHPYGLGSIEVIT